jgi:lipid II isoglutaminyl synthase (glutamine-hydrolysing)
MFFASIFVKITASLLKLLKRGDGTALPGLIVERVFPRSIKKLLKNIDHKVVITGTNGKTTTQTMLKSIIQTAGLRVLTNSAGANLKRGIISALLKNTNFWGQLKYDVIVLEVEEGTLPKVIQDIDPTVIAVTNLYRDQLDAYGEVDVTEKYIKEALKLSPDSKLILNLDDPRVSDMASGLKNEVVYTSIPKQFNSQLPYEGQIEESSLSPNTIHAQNIKINQNLNVRFSVEGGNIAMRDIEIKSPGFFHVYNALNSIAIAQELNIDTKLIHKGLANFEPAFGRGEEIRSELHNFTYKFLLVKNPAGMSLNLNLLRNTKKINLAILLNDNTADGKDVSWIWDSNFEELNNLDIQRIFVGGTRAQDLLVRIKYAIDKKMPEIILGEDIEELNKKIETTIPMNETIFVLPTYTALLELRKILGKSLE